MEQGRVVSPRVDCREGQETGCLGGGCCSLTSCQGAGHLDGGTEDGKEVSEATKPPWDWGR